MPATIYPLVESWDPCRICGSQSLRPLHVYKSRRMILPERFLALLGCEDCGVVQSTPVPSAEALDAWYTEPYGWETRSRDDEEKLIRRAKKKEERYAERLELLRVHLRPVGTGGPPTVFDFGCGLGSCWTCSRASAGRPRDSNPARSRLASPRDDTGCSTPSPPMGDSTS